MKAFHHTVVVISLLTFVPINGQDDRKYKDVFDDLQLKETIETKDGDDRYVCIRNYVIENHLTQHEIEENPKNINMIDSDCKEIIKEFRLQAAQAIASDKYLSVEQKDCVKRKFIKGKYFDSMAVTVALRQSSLLPSQMLEERNKFVEEMKEMTRNLNQCVMNNKTD